MTERPLRRIRYELWWAGAALLVAGAAAFFPLVNVLGYESAELFCLFTTISTAAIALKRLGDGSVDPARDGVGEAASRLIARALIPLAAPPVVLLLNAFRVPNCDPGMGLLLYLLLPVASTVVVVAVILPIAALLRRTRWRVLAYLGVILASVASSVAYLATEPPIFAFHPTIGYFAGSIYDEALALPPGLIAFRLMSLAFVGVVLSALSLARRRRQQRRWAGAGAVLLLSLVMWGSIWSQRFELRIESTREDIIEALGGVAESEHFVVYYPLSSPHLADQIDAILADHEFRYAQLRDFFGIEPEGPLRSFLYGDWRQKQRYMGAGRTLIAKPWLREIHLTYREIGDGHLAHEMAHLFSAAFGEGPLLLAGGTFGLDMGLIEGSAEAAAWDDRDLTAHGWAAAMYALELAPDLAAIQGAAGFWSQYSRTVYTLMGSFSRWLVAEQGPERFRQVYASADFEAVYGRPLDELVSDWRAFLAELPLSQRDLDLAEFRFDRPSIFGKRCARALAARARDGRLLAGGRRYDEAAECFADIVADDPDNTGYRLEYAEYLRQSGRYDEAEAIAAGVVETEGAGRVVQARAVERLGDIAWSRGDWQVARARYTEVLEAPLLDDDRRRVSVKREAVGDSEAREIVYDLFLAAPPPRRDAVTVELVEGEARTQSWLLSYLLGLRLFEAQAYERAADLLETALARMDPAQIAGDEGLFDIQRMAWRRRGQSLLFEGRFSDARAQFLQMARSGDTRYDARAAEGLDWAARCDWARARRQAARGE